PCSFLPAELPIAIELLDCVISPASNPIAIEAAPWPVGTVFPIAIEDACTGVLKTCAPPILYEPPTGRSLSDTAILSIIALVILALVAFSKLVLTTLAFTSLFILKGKDDIYDKYKKYHVRFLIFRKINNVILDC